MMSCDALCLIILEDNEERREAMLGRLRDRLPQYEVIFAATAIECIDWLHRRWESVLAISLDHDLDLICGPAGTWLEPGTGRQVADFLAERSPVCPVVIHSTNVSAVEGMQEVLEAGGWPVERIAPYGDVEWISEVWFPGLRSVMTDWTRRSPAVPTTNQIAP